MSKTQVAEAATPKAKKARAPAKDRTMYLLTESPLEGHVQVVKNGDTLVELMDKAQEAGKRVHYRKLTIPAGR